MLRKRYALGMKSISQRELRNQSGEIMRGLDRGESYRLTNRGEPVGLLTPLGRTTLEGLTLREGTQRMCFPKGIARDERVAEVLDDLRGAR